MFTAAQPCSGLPALQVNRCARYANGASHGGQITCPYDVMEQIVSEYIGAECPPMQEQGDPHLLQVTGAYAGFLGFGNVILRCTVSVCVASTSQAA